MDRLLAVQEGGVLYMIAREDDVFCSRYAVQAILWLTSKQVWRGKGFNEGRSDRVLVLRRVPKVVH